MFIHNTEDGLPHTPAHTLAHQVGAAHAKQAEK